VRPSGFGRGSPSLRSCEQDVELVYSLPDPWKRKLFVALCRRYGLKPFREHGRRYSTVQVRAPHGDRPTSGRDIARRYGEGAHSVSQCPLRNYSTCGDDGLRFPPASPATSSGARTQVHTGQGLATLPTAMSSDE